MDLILLQGLPIAVVAGMFIPRQLTKGVLVLMDGKPGLHFGARSRPLVPDACLAGDCLYWTGRYDGWGRRWAKMG